MKTTLILSTLILLASFAGCSDNMNVTDPLSANHYVQNQVPEHNSPVLIWSYDQLKVWTIDEGFVSNSITYEYPQWVPPQENIAGYLITFNVSTTADNSTNGYTALARVNRKVENGDEETIFQETNFSGTTTPTVSEEIKFGNVQFSEISFYIALFQMDNGAHSIPGNSVYLTLSDIKIYRLR